MRFIFSLYFLVAFRWASLGMVYLLVFLVIIYPPSRPFAGAVKIADKSHDAVCYADDSGNLHEQDEGFVCHGASPL
jgi:hypothetical protein